MGLFDIFTGGPAINAANQNKGILQFVDERGRNDITGAANTAAGILPGAYANARSDLSGGYGAGAGAINAGADQALGYLGDSSNAALGRLNNAGSYYDALSSLAGKYGGATTLGLNALGVNGQPGIDTARSAFQASPGYNFNLEQGLNAINRRRAAGGMLDSGNADRDAQLFGAGLASNEYNSWLNNLLGFTNPEATTTGAAASGRAAADTNAANLLSQTGRSQAQVAGTRGDLLARLAANNGTALAGLDTGEGSALANLYTQAANQRTNLDTNLAGPFTNQNTNAAQAELQGSKNLWGLGLAGAQLAAGLPPGSIGGLFGGGSGAAAANPGLAGGGYYGAGGNLYAGPGNYGSQSDPLGWLRNAWA